MFYFQVFANIKLKSSLADAPNHLFEKIVMTKQHCTDSEQKVIFKSIQQNSYMAHPECIILAMF